MHDLNQRLRQELASAVIFSDRQPISKRIEAASTLPDSATLDAINSALTKLRERAHEAAEPVIDSYLDELEAVRQWRQKCRTNGWPITLAPKYRRVSDGDDPEAARRLLVVAALDAYGTDDLDIAIERFEAEVYRAAANESAHINGAMTAVDNLHELRHLDALRIASEPFTFATTKHTNSMRAAVAVSEVRQRAAQHCQNLTSAIKRVGVIKVGPADLERDETRTTDSR